MKIFFPTEVFYPSQSGGPANTIYWLAKNLVKQGFEPVIVSSDKGIESGFPLNRWRENEAGRVIHVRTRWLHFPIGQTFRSLLNFRRADIVHISSVFYPTAFITAFAARLSGKRIVWSPRGELDAAALEFSSGRKRPILWCIRKLIGSYPVFHSTCDAESEYIRAVFGDGAEIVQVPNFIELPEKVNAEPGKYLLLLGRIHWKKGIENLIEALAMSDEFRASGHVLKIAGRDTHGYRAVVSKRIAELGLDERIEWVGHVEGDEKQRLLAGAFWTVMPSHSENFGIVVLESLAQNTPVIASKGSPWESLETERLGLWVDNSPEELAKAIDHIFGMSETEYAGYRSRGRDFVERNFDIGKNIDRWTEIYRSLR